jgi:hypothetical protein
MPSLQPQALKVKPPAHMLKVKLLPKAPVLRLQADGTAGGPCPAAPAPEVTAPKIEVNHFTPAVAKLVTGGARPTLIVHTGEFGSSATPTVNAPIQKVQTGALGTPMAFQDKASPTRIWWRPAPVRSICRREGKRQRSGRKQRYQGTIASAGFGNGMAQAGQGMAAATGAAPRCRPPASQPSRSARDQFGAQQGSGRTRYDTCGNHLEAQSGLH